MRPASASPAAVKPALTSHSFSTDGPCARQRRHHLAPAPVLAQDLTEIEVLVVDDGSTDGTLAAALAWARNLAVAQARAPLLAFLDSDDAWLPEKLSLQVAELERAGAEMCYCGALYYGDRQSYYIPLPRFTRLTGQMSAEAVRGNPVTPQTLLIRRDLYLELGGYDQDLRQYEDWEFTLRMSRRTEFAFVEEPQVIIYRTRGSLMDNVLTDAQSRELIVNRHVDLFDRSKPDKARQLYIAGRMWARAGNPARARSAYLAALRAYPGIRPLLAWGQSWLTRARPEGAGASRWD